MDKPEAPPAPDYAALAALQGSENRDTALFNANVNRVNQYTPDGSVTWSRAPQTATANNQSGLQLTTSGPTAATAASGAQDSGPLPYGPAQWGLYGYNPDEAAAAARGTTSNVRLAGTQIDSGATPAGPQLNPDDGSGWSQTVTYSPENQRLYDMGQQARLDYATTGLAAIDRVQQSLGTPLDTSNVRATNYGGNATTSMGMDQGVLADYIGRDLPQVVAGQASAGQGAAGQNIATTFDRSGVRALPGNIDDASRRRVEEALMSRIDPSLQRDEDMLRNRLLNSGIEVGTDAYNRELTLSGQHRNDARFQAVLAGGQEESRQVGLQQGLQAQEYNQALAAAQYRQQAESQMSAQQTQASLANAGMQTQASLANANNSTQTSAANAQLEAARRAQMVQAYGDSTRTNAAINQQNFNQQQDAAGFQNNAAQQELARQVALRQIPLNEANALRTGGQLSAPTFPSYYTGGSAGAAPVMDAGLAQNTANQNIYNQQTSSNNALWGAAATVGSAALMASDMNLKKNIEKVGEHPSGVGRYVWDWKDGSGSEVGVLAQELQQVRPDAVKRMPSGHLGVAYGLIGGH